MGASFYPPSLSTMIKKTGDTLLDEPIEAGSLPDLGEDFYLDTTPSPDDETVPCTTDEVSYPSITDIDDNVYPAYSLIGGRPIKRPTT